MNVATLLNEIIWAYDHSARAKRKWPAKHHNILWYTKGSGDCGFHHKDPDRLPHMAPGLADPEEPACGMTATDTWRHTIVLTNRSAQTGHPTQKPLGVLRRSIRSSSSRIGLVMGYMPGAAVWALAAWNSAVVCAGW